ncbi:MAG: hypothetical protein ACE5J7_02880 [Candidatus Aenigmatarchaeota archaeon]
MVTMKRNTKGFIKVRKCVNKEGKEYFLFYYCLNRRNKKTGMVERVFEHFLGKEIPSKFMPLFGRYRGKYKNRVKVRLNE